MKNIIKSADTPAFVTCYLLSTAYVNIGLNFVVDIIHVMAKATERANVEVEIKLHSF
jgi:hypothetical protein